MRKKVLTLNEVLRKKFNDKNFKKGYEEELKKLRLGYKITQLRIKHGLTQKQLAKKINSRQPVITRIENGDYLGYSIRTLQRVAARLNDEYWERIKR